MKKKLKLNCERRRYNTIQLNRNNDMINVIKSQDVGRASPPALYLHHAYF